MGELTKLLIKPAALGLGTTAALGGYYAVKNKGYKGKDGKFNGKQALKDLGKWCWNDGGWPCSESFCW